MIYCTIYGKFRMNNQTYINNGYKNRTEYLESLADDFNVDSSIVEALSDMLGENEDFDGLISELEDYSNIFC